jgi:cobalamin biosynthesis Mg chelatase CobN
MESKEVDWNQFLQDLEAQSESSERTTTADTEPEQVDWTQFLKDLQAQAESSERTATPPLIDMEAEEIDWSKFHEDLETQLKGAEDANEEEAAAVAMKTKAGKKTKEPKAKKTSPSKEPKAGKSVPPKAVGATDASTESTTSLSSSNTNTRVTGGLRSAYADVMSTSKPSGFWLLIGLVSLVVVFVVVKFVWKV